METVVSVGGSESGSGVGSGWEEEREIKGRRVKVLVGFLRENEREEGILEEDKRRGLEFLEEEKEKKDGGKVRSKAISS